jgi:hypothetical protein
MRAMAAAVMRILIASLHESRSMLFCMDLLGYRIAARELYRCAFGDTVREMIFAGVSRKAV